MSDTQPNVAITTSDAENDDYDTVMSAIDEAAAGLSPGESTSITVTITCDDEAEDDESSESETEDKETE